MNNELKNARLYGIIDLGYVRPQDIIGKTQQLLTGGVDILQLRAKNCAISDIKTWAQEILPLCREHHIPFIINDYPEIAIEIEADGVHIGQDDGELSAVKKLVGNQMIVGRSTHSTEQAQRALLDGFDYIGFGPLYATPTKEGRPPIGLSDVKKVEDSVGQCLPVFCIGGIKKSNIEEVKEAGATRVVVVSELLKAPDSSLITREMKELMTLRA